MTIVSCCLRIAVWTALLLGPLQAARAEEPFVHALAWGAKPAYGPDFKHFGYVNPTAPRGGVLSLDGFGSFDKLNPFTLKGLVAAGVGPHTPLSATFE